MKERRASYEEIKAVLQELHEDLLFTLMASDKELFHSNVHGRIFSKNEEIKKAFFQKFASKNEAQKESVVVREFKHIDLFMQCPGYNPIAIENKLFADFGDKQLERYTESLNSLKTDWHGILLTLKSLNMGDISGDVQENWIVITYSEFATFLNTHMDSMVVEEFEREFVVRYINLIEKLDKLTSLLLPLETDSRLELTIGLANSIEVSINKMRYRLVADEIRKGCHTNLGTAQFRVGYGISHAKPFLELEFELKDGNMLGWQYQEGQFRLFARCNNLSGKGKHEARTKFALDQYADWFDFEYLSEFFPVGMIIRPEESTKLLKFDPNFVYRYVKTSDLSQRDLISISKKLSVKAESR